MRGLTDQQNLSTKLGTLHEGAYETKLNECNNEFGINPILDFDAVETSVG